MRARLHLVAGAFASLALASVVLAVPPTASAQPKALAVSVLSSEANRVSGGDALVRVSDAGATVTLNGADVTSAFHREPGGLIGLVRGLKDGANTVVARSGRAVSRLTLTNYSISGPIFSGPHQTPYICETEALKLMDGSTLGPAVDANCSAPTNVQYAYLPKDAVGRELESPFKPLRDPTKLPDDVAQTTTTTGLTVNFIVRIETSVIDRAIAQNIVLHDPTVEAQPAPWSPPRAWNRRLVARHGGGCAGGWYIQGGMLMTAPINGEAGFTDDVAMLGQGYAMFSNTFNSPRIACNPVLSTEATLMNKEHVVETFGVPDFTLSLGCSGGSYDSLQPADAAPGLYDGILIGCVFPDALSLAVSGSDARLLTNYALSEKGRLTDDQLVAVSGLMNLKALFSLAKASERADPLSNRSDPLPKYEGAIWTRAVPKALRYDPKDNPRGARPTVYDTARNIYGVDPATGRALRAFDNVGVQYGLAALRQGAITPAQFVDLNARIGGFDQDANYVPQRSVGDAGAIRRAYQSGLSLSGAGGLAGIPILVSHYYNAEHDNYHLMWNSFALRERLTQANGDAGNMVLWRGGVTIEPGPLSAGPDPSPRGQQFARVMAAKGFQSLVAWVEALKTDAAPGSAHAKVLRSRPAAVTDGCFVAETFGFIAGAQTFSRAPDSRCNTLWPTFSEPRLMAEGPLAANVLKCQLKPLDRADYAATFTDPEWARLQATFPQGVCDWAKPGVAQTPFVPKASFGPSPDNLVFDFARP